MILSALLLAFLPATPPQQPALQAAPLRVTGTSPALNALNVPRGGAISITFNRAMNPATVGPLDLQVSGRWSGATGGALTVSPNGKTLTFLPSTPFSAGETVLVLMSRSLTSAGGSRLARGFAFNFWVDSRASSVAFTKTQTLGAGDTPYGAYGGDIDADGDLDLCVPNENTSDVSVYLNNGAGTFGRDTTYGVGLHCSPSEAADFDFDGNLDLAVANIFHDDVSVLFGNGDGTFQPQVRLPVGDEPRGLTLLDVDGDGDMDIVTSNREKSTDNGDLSLILCNGDGTFQPEVRIEGGVSRETGVTACDMNNDGVFDIVCVGYGNNSVGVLFGDGRGGFGAPNTRTIGGRPWMVVWGDVDGDGWNDVGAILSSSSAAGICRNDGLGGLLAPATYPTTSFPIALDFGDLNGDGMLDLATSAFSGGQFRQYLNNGSGTFVTPFTLPDPAIQAGSCTVLHDVDGDGDVDITAIDEIADLVFIFRQDG